MSDSEDDDTYAICGCHKQFKTFPAWRRHHMMAKTAACKRPPIKDPEDSRDWYGICACRRKFKDRHSWYYHRRKAAKIVCKAPPIKAPASSDRVMGKTNSQWQCLECNMEIKTRTYEGLREHLSEKHGMQFEYIEATFNSKEEFLVWRKGELRNRFGPFARECGDRVCKDFHVLKYVCSYQGSCYIKPEAIRKYKHKLGITKKSGIRCTARLSAKIDNNSGAVEVTGCVTHYGHSTTAKPDALREQIEQLDRLCVRPDKILQRLTHPDNGQPAQNEHSVRSVMRDMGLSPEFRLNDTDLEYLNSITRNDEGLLRPNVIAYKPQDVDQPETGLLPQDFICVSQSRNQANFLLERIQEAAPVCLDIKPCYTVHSGFLAMSLLTTGKYGGGVIVAYAISNSDSEDVLRFFFEALKLHCEAFLQPSAFISDDVPHYFETWAKVFSSEMYTSKRICYWHLKRRFEEDIYDANFPQAKVINDKPIAVYVRGFLKALIDAKTKVEFQHQYTHFLDACQSHEDLDLFGTNFVVKYGNRPEEWATAYLAETLPRTTMAHQNHFCALRSMYQNSKRYKKLSDVLPRVLEFVENAFLEQQRESQSDIKLATRIRDIFSGHQQALVMNLLEGAEVEEGKRWVIVGAHAEEYEVAKMRDSCPNCKLVCAQCQTCIHIYECSCSIKTPMCKHIHASIDSGILPQVPPTIGENVF